ncbi:MAG: hypothetical protein MUF07_11810 [Steroidobacteraceae bacterium]|nr:hypothetical protein [Steroidobacteraceae bacterium]
MAGATQHRLRWIAAPRARVAAAPVLAFLFALGGCRSLIPSTPDATVLTDVRMILPDFDRLLARLISMDTPDALLTAAYMTSQEKFFANGSKDALDSEIESLFARALARAPDDPQLVAARLAYCLGPRKCDREAPSARLRQVDPENALGYDALVVAARGQGAALDRDAPEADPERTTRELQSMAGRERMDAYANPLRARVTRAVAAARNHETPRVRDISDGAGLLAGQLLPVVPGAPSACRDRSVAADAERLLACRALIRLMLRSDSSLVQAHAAGIARGLGELGGPEAAAALEERRQAAWRASQVLSILRQRRSYGRFVRGEWRALLQHAGEAEAQRTVLRDFSISDRAPPGWEQPKPRSAR